MSGEPRGAKDLAGLRFGRWLALAAAGLDRNRKPLWLCRCECGVERRVVRRNLVSGLSLQCRACANAHAGHGTPREARPKPAKPCEGCGVAFTPRRSTAKWCSQECKGKTRWASMTPAEREAHAARVKLSATPRSKEPCACASCGKPASKRARRPGRAYCSRECLDGAKRAGVYKRISLARRAAADYAATAAELARRLESLPKETSA